MFYLFSHKKKFTKNKKIPESFELGIELLKGDAKSLSLLYYDLKTRAQVFRQKHF